MAESILVVDDESSIRMVVQRILESVGYEVITASNGKSGLQQFHETQPQLVILDVTMPEMDGWEVCRQIRTISCVPIIIFSGQRSPEDMQKNLDMGVTTYLLKPFSPKELQDRVDAALH